MHIWGLDLGTTSIGFAVIDHDPARDTGAIRRLGARIFPEGVTEDKKEPRNKTRRAKRLMRRGIRRRKLRRRLLNEALAEAGLLPRFGSVEWREVMAADPYVLRKEGLTRDLEPHELGRALYHLAKRRGFAGRGIEQEKDKLPEDAAAREDAARLRAEMGRQTLGAFLAEQAKKRGHHHTRDMVETEFDLLWAAQKPSHSALADAAFAERVRHLVFFQRPTFWRLATLGHCPLVPGAELIPKGSWVAQRWLVLEQLTKLRIAGANRRPLDEAERAILLDLAHQQKTITWNGVRRSLRKLWRDNGEAEDQRFNLEVSGAEKEIKGNIVEIELARIFGTEWQNHPYRDAIRRDIHRRLWDADYEKVGKARVEIRRPDAAAAARREAAFAMQRDWKLTGDQAAALAKLELPSGWLRFSTEAIEAMLPEMERGRGVGDLLNGTECASWRERTFPMREQRNEDALRSLPSHPRAMPELRNPAVNRALNELRKVANNLLGLYGRPDAIRVELTRELRESKRRRSERLSRNKEQEGQRKKAIADLAAHGIENPSGRDIEKWMLWKEANERCPYTGDHIGFEALFGTGKYDVDHIWPRSRSLDNGFGNKTLCRKDVNIAKGNRTPFEMYAHDPEAWHALKLHLADCKLPEYKVRRFVKDFIDEADSEQFAERQLADTGWAAREARDFLKRLWPGNEPAVRVQTVNGRITAQLRRQWGLNSVLNPDGETKTRADHRHHAVDALAAALTTPGIVKRLSDWHRMRERSLHPPKFDAPWPGLLNEARNAVAGIVVSHKTRRKVSGALHAETVMGNTGLDERTKSRTYRLFVTSKPVERLSKSEIGDIRDPEIRNIVARRVEERGGDPKKAVPPYPRLPGPDGANGPEIKKVRLFKKQQLALMVRAGTGYADAAANHHVAIYRLPDGKTDFEVVSLFEASRRLAKREPIVRRIRDGSAILIMSLSAGDTIQFSKEREGLPTFWRVQKIASKGQISLLDVNDASPQESSLFEPTVGGIMSRKAIKVSVDPIGRVRPARD